MSRIFSRPGDQNPSIDKEAVLNFFEQRAAKVASLGTTRAVIYQDKNLDLAERRDAAEKAFLYPKLDLRPEDHVLDAGCGTGRWAGLLIPGCATYHGVDVSPGLIDVATSQFHDAQNVRFTVCSIDKISIDAIGSPHLFSKLISFGVYIYLNDDEIRQALHQLTTVAAPNARILLREPVGVDLRLTLKEHFSEDMDQYYSAIYRTEAELKEMFDATLAKADFQMIDSGDVYQDTALNNRTDTKQRFFLFER